MNAPTMSLNDVQRRAVEHGDSPLLIVAGAGTGKTRVITHRVASLLTRGFDPARVLAITFTNKAAREMKERVEHLTAGSDVWVSTFHALSARALRMDGPAIQIPRDYTIRDRDDQLSLVRRLLKQLQLNSRDFPPAKILRQISEWKNFDRSVDDVRASAEMETDLWMAGLYQAYAQEMKESRSLDFDDLLLEFRRLLLDPEFGDRWRGRFDHVLVDEYQDTNRIQGEISRALVSHHQRISACGDPDQSIYSWRGADVTNILEFEKQFPGAEVVRLEKNYRSTPSILAVASAAISRNRQRIERELYSESEDGPRPSLRAYLSESDEAEETAGAIQDCVEERGLQYGDVAILYRTNALSRGFERCLRARGIPYQVVGAVEFYARKEVKDLLAFLRLRVNPWDSESFLRIVNLPARGIGAKSQQAILDSARESNTSLVDCVRKPGLRPKLRGAAVRGLADLGELLDWLMEREDRGISDLLHELTVRLDYENFLEETYPVGADERWENVRSLMADTFEYEAGDEDGDLLGYLEERALIQDTDQIGGAGNAVSLMTLHSAKGLEFPVVFLTGLEENVLPHRRSYEEGRLEEERRLFYVGITRAKQLLQLSYASERFQFGRWELSRPSPFLLEIPEDLLQVPRRDTAFDSAASGFSDDTYVELDEDQESAGFQVGDQVRHSGFGFGQVTQVVGGGRSLRLRIRFSGGEKTIVADYAQLKRVDGR